MSLARFIVAGPPNVGMNWDAQVPQPVVALNGKSFGSWNEAETALLPLSDHPKEKNALLQT